jgi:hypothetical protein
LIRGGWAPARDKEVSGHCHAQIFSTSGEDAEFIPTQTSHETTALQFLFYERWNMALTLSDVRTHMEQEGLYVSPIGSKGLLIAAEKREGLDSDMVIFRQTCVLQRSGDNWEARFDVLPPAACVIQGSLSSLENLIAKVYRSLRHKKMSYWSAFSEEVGDPKSFLKLTQGEKSC